ncbi:hypothetical protein SAMN05660766_0559 [Curtobacterium sp. 314Chir4.1]|uniref:hypothetical protein n=1 Tax=Curtobacterium sp. 314Chir4.1 TaxID=1279028 RepID=UPI000BD15541|nr:hypothetical protein [Curtobacterium sp. 314Chir4.1]SOC86896.1 hypothetical protein SAMN05660766_0559 [Curtobacterium sp. 314Chir4.1]
MSSTSKTPLEREVPSQADRNKFADFVDLMRLLADCIIGDDYTVPDDLSQALQLSAAGQSMVDKVARAPKPDRRIPVKEARLMCGLALGQGQLFIDVKKTDVDAIAASVSKQLLSGKIRFPFTFGREAYDAYADQHDEGLPTLTFEESQRFLDALPQGVHQYGKFVTGPFGLHTSADNREIRSGRSVEAFHCADMMCERIHRTLLTTSVNAPINKFRERFHEELDGDHQAAIDWFQEVDNMRDIGAVMFSDVEVGVTATLIGDALSVDELRSLVAHLFDATAGVMRGRVSAFLEVGDAHEAVRRLNRASLMQILLLSDERSVQRGLDRLVNDGAITIPRGEVRRPVVNQVRRSGAFGLLPELGHHGVRFASVDQGFAILRLRNELQKLHDHDLEGRDELAWQLRDVPGEGTAEKLDRFFRNSDPAEAIQRLVLSRHTLVERLAQSIGIEHGLDESDESIVERVLWKLGFSRYESEDPRAEFWRLHHRLIELAKVSRTPASRDTEEYLGVASKYFRELERFLSEALAFAAWSLLHDHTSSARPYEYGLESDQRHGLELVQAAADSQDTGDHEFDFLNGRLELYSLVRGFGLLGNHLRSLDPDEHPRPASEVPAYARGSQLKRFPFRHRVPFLDLTAEARAVIPAELINLSKQLQRDRVNDFRNSHQHYQKTAAGIKQIEDALAGLELALRTVEALGFALVEFKVDDETHDRWGRSEFYFAAPRGQRHVISRPSGFDWLGMPPLSSSQYVVTSAIFDAPNEVIRVRRRVDSTFADLWAGFPARRQDRANALKQNPVEHPNTEVHGQ